MKANFVRKEAASHEQHRFSPQCLRGRLWLEGVYKILRRDGYTVTIVQNPTISLEDDV
jgi:hypothetical protein